MSDELISGGSQIEAGPKVCACGHAAPQAVKPIRDLSPREESVAELVGRGYSYKRIAAQLGIRPTYVANIVDRIADVLPNPDDLSPQMAVALWAAHRKWLAGHKKSSDAAA